MRTLRNFNGPLINTTASSTPRIAASLYDNTNMYFYLDAVVASPVASTGNFGIQAYGIGTNVESFSNEYFFGYIGEILVYNTALTNSQRVQIEQYLGQKWGIPSSLPTGHPGKSLRAFSTVFTPKVLVGLNLWLDAADSSTLTIPSGSVTAWADKSGNGNNGTAVGAPVVSTQVRNPYIYFNGSSGFRGAVSITTTQITSFAVTIFTGNAGGNNRIVSLGVTSANDSSSTLYTIALYQQLNTTNLLTFRNGAISSITNTVTGTPILTASIYNGTNSTIYLNGVAGASASTSGSFGVTNYGIGLNASTGGPGPFTGYIGEVLVFNTALTTPNRQIVEGYLAWKWGMQSSLPSTHPYLKSSP